MFEYTVALLIWLWSKQRRYFMKYRLSLSVVLATSLILSTTVAQAQEGNHKQTTEKMKKRIQVNRLILKKLKR